MDEEESKEIIVHKTLLENQSKDIRESEYNIVHETLSQNNSTDVIASINHIFRVKRKIGKIRKGVGNRSGSQDQSKV